MSIVSRRTRPQRECITLMVILRGLVVTALMKQIMSPLLGGKDVSFIVLLLSGLLSAIKTLKPNMGYRSTRLKRCTFLVSFFRTSVPLFCASESLDCFLSLFSAVEAPLNLSSSASSEEKGTYDSLSSSTVPQ